MTTSTGIANWIEATRPRLRPQRILRENDSLRRLFWLYFWLLIVEGALRKWVVPALANYLLLIRDPIPLAVLWIGIRNRVFPRTFVVYAWASLALACLVAGLFVLPSQPVVVFFGFRCDFLHLPMLAVAPIVFDRDDIDRMIRAVIYVSVPIALLMAWQFHSPNNSWINSGLDNTFQQLESAKGHVRPPGPFSYIAGPACFCALLAAVLTGSAVDHRNIARPLLFVGAGALIVAALYSSSRGLVGNVAIVIATGLLGSLTSKPRRLGRYLAIICSMSFVAIFIGSSSLMGDTVEVFSTRISDASQGAALGGVQGLIDRTFGGFTDVAPAVRDAPFAGQGLGLGTSVASALLTGKVTFMLAESEWPRMVLESGPVLGLLCIAFRMGLVVWLGWRSLQSVRRGPVFPACLYGACVANVAIGQFGQTTILGFTMLTAGLCVAAAGERDDEPLPIAADERGAMPGARGDLPVPA